MENIARAKKEDENFTADKADPELSLDLEVEGRESFEQKTQAVGQVSFDLKTFFLVQYQGGIRKGRELKVGEGAGG